MQGQGPTFAFVVVIVVVLALSPLPVLSGANECRRFTGANRPIKCFECNSLNETLCKTIDKSNTTGLESIIKPCNGCCVKFDHYFPKQEAYVLRTCTQLIEINYFMVDHVCMAEGKGYGKMCFCEDDHCNNVPSLSSSIMSLLLLPLGTILS